MDKWISVKDRLPKNGETIIGLWNYGIKDAKYKDNVASIVYVAGEEIRMKLTHWMPLPEPPEIKE